MKNQSIDFNLQCKISCPLHAYVQFVLVDSWKLSICNRACHPGGHNWNYCPGALSLSQVTATHFKIGHRIFHLWVPNLQMSCRELTAWQGTSMIVPVMATRVTCLIGKSCNNFLMPFILRSLFQTMISVELKYMFTSSLLYVMTHI